MNHAREFYLKTYGVVDTLDKYISNSKMGYRSWKYWHSAMNHGKGMALAVAYDMYKEVAEGELDPTWKITNVLPYHKFHDKLSKQLLNWDPLNQDYPGDKEMRRVTQRGKGQREQKRRQKVIVETHLAYEEAVPMEVFKKNKDGKTSRLCGNLSEFKDHIQSVVKQGTGGRRKGALQCMACNKATYTSCGICLGHPPLCFFPAKGKAAGNTCFLDYHNDHFFGLACRDTITVMGRTKGSWTEANNAKRIKHAEYMKEVCKQHDDSTE